MKQVTIPNSVKEIEGFAFYSCSSLESVVIPSSVTYIGLEAFSSCENLRCINVSEENPKYSNFGNNGVLYDKYIISIICCPAGITNETFEIPNIVTTIEQYAFLGCQFSNVVIPKFVNLIEKRAFESCTRLISVTIPDSVTSINVCVFSNCISLETVIIGKGVKTIQTEAFYYCRKIRCICFGGVSEPKIAQNAFDFWMPEINVTTLPSYLGEKFGPFGVNKEADAEKCTCPPKNKQ